MDFVLRLFGSRPAPPPHEEEQQHAKARVTEEKAVRGAVKRLSGRRKEKSNNSFKRRTIGSFNDLSLEQSWADCKQVFALLFPFPPCII